MLTNLQKEKLHGRRTRTWDVCGMHGTYTPGTDVCVAMRILIAGSPFNLII
jgi:hypothetical protein